MTFKRKYNLKLVCWRLHRMVIVCIRISFNQQNETNESLCKICIPYMFSFTIISDAIAFIHTWINEYYHFWHYGEWTLVRYLNTYYTNDFAFMVEPFSDKTAKKNESSEILFINYTKLRSINVLIWNYEISSRSVCRCLWWPFIVAPSI